MIFLLKHLSVQQLHNSSWPAGCRWSGGCSGWLPAMFLCSFSPGPEPNWRVKPNQWKILWSNLGVKNIVSFELLSLCCRDLSSAWTGPGEQGENRRQFGLIARFEYVETFFQDSTYIIVHNQIHGIVMFWYFCCWCNFCWHFMCCPWCDLQWCQLGSRLCSVGGWVRRTERSSASEIIITIGLACFNNI